MAAPARLGSLHAATIVLKSERQRPKLSLTYTTGTPARWARSRSRAMRRAEASARRANADPPGKSKRLMTSMRRSAVLADGKTDLATRALAAMFVPVVPVRAKRAVQLLDQARRRDCGPRSESGGLR